LLILIAGCVAPTSRLPSVSDEVIEAERQKQLDFATTSFVNASTRLYAIAYPILEKGVPLCEKHRYATGFIAVNRYLYGEELADSLQRTYSLSDALNVLAIVPGSAADKAGMRVGDAVVAIGGNRIMPGKKAMIEFGKVMNGRQYSSTDLTVLVERDSRQQTLLLKPQQVCDYDVVLHPDTNAINAYADGENIFITKRMMDFFESDNEAALVIAHEIAHNARDHIKAKQQNAMLGVLGGLLVDIAAAYGGVNTNGEFANQGGAIGARAYSVEFEKEADYVGLYFMARAGYDIQGVERFWRRMALQNPNAITLQTTHPSSPERFLLMGKTTQEIEQKQLKGLPLLPEEMPKQ
ncbi:MAG: M48 family metalloprotease, partial [Pseudomonadales bacterium]|nr:M48 family metalloprotease [Pseudomonadales bacterium]